MAQKIKSSKDITQDSYNFPKISSQRQNPSLNPFIIPKDLEVYKTKMLEKERKNDQKASSHHISKKGIKNNMEGKLKEFFKDTYEEKEDNKNNKVNFLFKLTLRYKQWMQQKLQ